MTEVAKQKPSGKQLNFTAHEGAREKLDTLAKNSVSTRGKKMTNTQYINYLISWAYENKLYFKESVTPDLRYKAEKSSLT